MNPKDFGLHSRVVLRSVSENEIAIVRFVKSRIIRKDALKIVEQAETIKAKHPGVEVSLVCTDNICSKSKALLTESGIPIYIE